jgi:hypothetical protein
VRELRQVLQDDAEAPQFIETVGRQGYRFIVPFSSAAPPVAGPQVEVPVAEAEACFLKAITIAQQQQAKSLELRAAMSLARLWQQQGKRTKGHHLLSKLYHWFTEGFDTKDLREAKALLDVLST